MNANPVEGLHKLIPQESRRSGLVIHQNTVQTGLLAMVGLVLATAVIDSSVRGSNSLISKLYRFVINRIHKGQDNDGRRDLSRADISRVQVLGPKIVACTITVPISPWAWGYLGLTALALDSAVRGSNSALGKLYRVIANRIHKDQDNNGGRDLIPANTSRNVRRYTLDVERLDPHVWEDACTILGLTHEEGKDEDAIRKAHSHSMTQLTRRSKNIEGAISAEIDALIEEVEQAYKTLIDSLETTTSGAANHSTG